MYRLRFNLSRGKNYRKWKITNPDKSVEYIDPIGANILLMNATLINRKKTAADIFNGSTKKVCSWIQAEEILIHTSANTSTIDVDIKEEVSYNPKLNPYWICKGNDYDNLKLPSLITKENKVFVI